MIGSSKFCFHLDRPGNDDVCMKCGSQPEDQDPPSGQMINHEIITKVMKENFYDFFQIFGQSRSI